MPVPRASASRPVRPANFEPAKAPPNLPTLAITMSPTVRVSSIGSRRMVKSADKPAVPKNTGMKNALIRPRNCSSIWRVRIGDSPTRMPATKAPSTVCTPIRSVMIDMIDMITRMAVITAKSLTNVSFTQRMTKNTARRPMVRLTPMNTKVPMMLFARENESIEPCSARLKITAVIIHPTVSSMIAEARMTWPTVRRMKFISRMMVATIFTDAIDKAVPRNSEVMSRMSGCGSILSGSARPSPTPQTNGTAMPTADAIAEVRPVWRTRLRSVSIPVSRSRTRTPNCAIPSSIAFCSFIGGKSRCCQSGKRAPRTDGPRMRPAISWPMTAGWPMRSIASPSTRPMIISAINCATKINSDGPEPPGALAAQADGGTASRMAGGRTFMPAPFMRTAAKAMRSPR